MFQSKISNFTLPLIWFSSVVNFSSNKMQLKLVALHKRSDLRIACANIPFCFPLKYQISVPVSGVIVGIEMELLGNIDLIPNHYINVRNRLSSAVSGVIPVRNLVFISYIHLNLHLDSASVNRVGELTHRVQKVK